MAHASSSAMTASPLMAAGLSLPVTGLASDSRDVEPGYLFAALSGTREDGARFIAAAKARGAIAVLGRPELQGSVEAAGLIFIGDANPRARLAHLAAAFFGAQPKTVAAVTGTNGKTSVSVFLRQIWAQLGYRAASLGTIGIVGPDGTQPLAHTTPDPIALHRVLSSLARSGVDHLVIEASSHGLDQHRLDGLVIAAAGFTNITRDHLDYHPDFEHYFAAKARLFLDLLRDDGTAVINADGGYAARLIGLARARGLRLLTCGDGGETLRLVARTPSAAGQSLTARYHGQDWPVTLPLAGDFQASNALLAAGLALGLGAPADAVFAALGALKGADGRLEKVACAKSGAPVYVDYAHTPDALETVLRAMRPHVAGRLAVVFGCGGDRDAGKRPLMGAAAIRLADRVIVTDDNPRSEEPGAIRAQILAAAPGAEEIGDRAAAIRAAIEGLTRDDALVIAGKGHEQGQIIGHEIRPFSDRAEAVAAAVILGGRPAEERP